MKLTHREALIVQLGLFYQALVITREKRADYSDETDPYGNYREGNEISGIAHAWQYAMRRNMEKFTRRKNIMLSSGGVAQSADDPFMDSARDSINLVHIEFGLELEEIAHGSEILKELECDAKKLAELASEFLFGIEQMDFLGD